MLTTRQFLRFFVFGAAITFIGTAVGGVLAKWFIFVFEWATRP